MILGADGEAVQAPWRGERDAISEDGYLPEAVINYLARPGLVARRRRNVSVEQFVQWFDLDHISRSAAQFNHRKTELAEPALPQGKVADDARLAALVRPCLEARGVTVATPLR